MAQATMAALGSHLLTVEHGVEGLHRGRTVLCGQKLEVAWVSCIASSGSFGSLGFHNGQSFSSVFRSSGLSRGKASAQLEAFHSLMPDIGHKHRAFRRGRLSGQQPNQRQAPCWLCKSMPTDASEPDDGGSESSRESSSESTVGSSRHGNSGEQSESRGARQEDESENRPAWSIAARRSRLQEAAASMVGDPFRDMVTSASKRIQDMVGGRKATEKKEEDVNVAPPKDDKDTEEDKDWATWQRVMEEVGKREELLATLKGQMEDAIDVEDFKEAAKLKAAIAACQESDVLAQASEELKLALAEERYADAARIRDQACLGLVGWWVGMAEGVSDLFGRIVNIVLLDGRLVARSYTARQLAVAGEGTPVFELYPVYLQRALAAPSPRPAASLLAAVDILSQAKRKEAEGLDGTAPGSSGSSGSSSRFTESPGGATSPSSSSSSSSASSSSASSSSASSSSASSASANASAGASKEGGGEGGEGEDVKARLAEEGIQR
eukprot:jgi/Mesen1/6878/ME000353S05901